jgi:hypothetical protein
MRMRFIPVGLALGLMASAPIVLGQKMYKCPDGKGGTTFQQTPCPPTAEEVDAHKKEKERLEGEARRKKDEEAQKAEAALQKMRERDKAYQEQVNERAREQEKSKAVEQRMLEGTTKQKGVDDGSLPAGFEQSHPGTWKEVPNIGITAALGKNKTPGCAQYRYRQRAGGLPEFVVQCSVDKVDWVTYFVWPQAETVKGPAKF